jgi:carbonic anhydrase
MKERKVGKEMLLVVCILLATGSAHAGGGAHWGYSGEGGPEHWGNLSEAYTMCGAGKNQSPIDIDSGQAIDVDQAVIIFDYDQTPLELANNGHTIQISYASGSRITVEGHAYKLVQFHFHTPSENKIDGEFFDLEAHLVHADEKGNLAVVGIMFREGGENPVIEKLWEHMPGKTGATNRTGEMIRVMEMLPDNRDYYGFTGSLTTPPCAEGVRWMVLKEPVSISKAQVEKFHGAMGHANNRPVQPLNARKVLK